MTQAEVGAAISRVHRALKILYSRQCLYAMIVRSQSVSRDASSLCAAVSSAPTEFIHFSRFFMNSIRSEQCQPALAIMYANLSNHGKDVVPPSDAKFYLLAGQGEHNGQYLASLTAMVLGLFQENKFEESSADIQGANC